MLNKTILLLSFVTERKIIVMTGAGISTGESTNVLIYVCWHYRCSPTAAGIPDFRSPGTGLYDNLQKYNLSNPQAIFEIGYFRRNPQPFFHLAKELYPAKFKVQYWAQYIDSPVVHTTMLKMKHCCVWLCHKLPFHIQFEFRKKFPFLIQCFYIYTCILCSQPCLITL